MTNGSSVTNSTSDRARGTRSWTQYAVGTISARLAKIVMMPTIIEYPRLPRNIGSDRALV